MSKLPAIFETGLTSVSASTDQIDDVGTIRIEGQKIYRYVKFLHGTSTVDVTAGDVCVYSGSTGYTAAFVTSDYSDISDIGLAAGVFQAAATTTSQFMWIQIRGPATLTVTLGGTATDGSPLTITGAADKAMDMVAATAPNSEPAYATAVDASAQTIVCNFPW